MDGIQYFMFARTHTRLRPVDDVARVSIQWQFLALHGGVRRKETIPKHLSKLQQIDATGGERPQQKLLIRAKQPDEEIVRANLTVSFTDGVVAGELQRPRNARQRLEDVEALMEVVHKLDGDKGLDLILHSPGGSPDAAEAVVHYLRSKFKDVRVIVPQAAMSAATMLACAADRIVMGKHSSLGPIDPQFIVSGPNGAMAHPAQAILDQFAKAQEKCKGDPQYLAAYVQPGPDEAREQSGLHRSSEATASTRERHRERRLEQHRATGDLHNGRSIHHEHRISNQHDASRVEPFTIWT